MKESTKEWLGIKPADFVIYAGFLMLLLAYYSKNLILDSVFLVVGLTLCLLSCRMGMKPHPELGVFNNTVKLLAYPACTLLFVFFCYLNYTVW